MVKRPAYQEIAEWLRVVAERRGPGALMPTITQVCEEFGVAGVQTVRDAYAPLVDEGLVERLDSPRRWAVVDRGQVPTPGPDVARTLVAAETALEQALSSVQAARRGL